MRQPAFYIPHGAGPCFFMEWTRGPADTWTRTEAFLRGLADALPERPKAILVISGHWEAPVFTVGSSERPELIYDYFGFPEHTYGLSFEAPGSPDLAARIRGLLTEAGIASDADPERGWDHGVFVPLKLVTPEADIPVVQLSLKASLDPAEHLAAGRALAPLRDEGVLIVGSGMSWHNMRGFSPAFTQASAEFDAWLTQAVSDAAKLVRWDRAPHARQAHPREEHLIPLLVAAGAAEGEPARGVFRDTVMDVVVSAFRFGEPELAR